MQEIMKNRAISLLAENKVDAVLVWEKGIFDYDVTPAIFSTKEEIESKFIFNKYCGANLSKYLVKFAKDKKVAVFLKPCDTYSLNQLIAEHKVKQENVYVLGVECNGMLDEKGNELEKCVNCKSRKHVIYNELIGTSGEVLDSKRFSQVEELENMTAEERFNFWRNELSRCIRCNACRNVCPACTCEKCVFDNPKSGVENKAAVNSFEENMFHIIRAFHVAGRCTDCGECSRVCPEHIPLHLLNRKFIKDINAFYGDYQAGETINERGPLVNYQKTDVEPSIVHERGNQ